MDDTTYLGIPLVLALAYCAHYTYASKKRHNLEPVTFDSRMDFCTQSDCPNTNQHPRADANFCVNIIQIRLNGFFANVNFRGDCFIGPPCKTFGITRMEFTEILRCSLSLPGFDVGSIRNTIQFL